MYDAGSLGESNSIKIIRVSLHMYISSAIVHCTSNIAQYTQLFFWEMYTQANYLCILAYTGDQDDNVIATLGTTNKTKTVLSLVFLKCCSFWIYMYSTLRNMFCLFL